MADLVFLAVDIGASSGRHVAGRFDGQRLSLEEVYRFENGPVWAAGHYYWDLLRQWGHVIDGLPLPVRKSPARFVASAWIPGVSISVCSAGEMSCSAIPTPIAIPGPMACSNGRLGSSAAKRSSPYRAAVHAI